MDPSTTNRFLTDLHNWGHSLYYSQGWRLPYWDEDDWRQYAVEWGLRVLDFYNKKGEILDNPKHAFSLVKTAVYHDIIDQTRSVRPDSAVSVEDHTPVQEDMAWAFCIPQQAQEFVKRLMALTFEQWEKAEAHWKSLGRKKLTTSPAGLSFLTDLPENVVRASIVLLRSHYSPT